MTDSDPLIEVQGLMKYFPIRRGIFSRHVGDVKAVDGVDFQVAHRETLSLVGESGCGKTTVGRTMLRLLPPTAGRALYRAEPGAEAVDLFELDGKAMRKRRRDLQIIFQDPYGSLNPRITVGNAIGEALAVHGIASGMELEQRVEELLKHVGLRADVGNRYPHEFSGGQRQRVGIARALALRPRLIVCDEAVSALDVSIQAQIVNLLGELQERFNLAYLFIAHDLAVIRHLCDEICVMYLGRIVEQAPRDELFESPRHPYTQALLSAVPHPNPHTERTRERIVLAGDVPSPLDPPTGCTFHPRCVHASEVPEDRCSRECPTLVSSGSRSAACHLP